MTCARVLVTRAEPGASATAAALEARGREALKAPLLAVRTLDAEIDFAGVQAILATSANAARALPAAARGRRLLCVGEATAAAARAAGFDDVWVGAGDVAGLAALAKAQLRAQDGRLVYGRGREVAADLAGDLAAAGFEVAETVLYAAEPATRLPEATVRALEAGTLGAALFHSPRAARAFVDLVAEAGLEARLGAVAGFGLSARVAAALSGLGWRSLAWPAAPNEAALLDMAAPRSDSRTGG